MIELRIEELKQMEELSVQYQKELTDLINRKGLAKVMSEDEIKNAIRILNDSITQLKENITNLKLDISEVKKQHDSIPKLSHVEIVCMIKICEEILNSITDKKLIENINERIKKLRSEDSVSI